MGVPRRAPAATGTAQEFTNLPADRVVRLPGDTSFEIGASLGVPAMTAHRALTVSEDGPARLYPGALTGKVVLVAGGAGAVGHAAIQLARWADATVVTTISSPAKAALATAAGADHVINYRDEDAAGAIAKVADGVDLVVEVAIAANSQLNLDVIKPRASIAIYANDGGSEFTVPSDRTWSRTRATSSYCSTQLATRPWRRRWKTSHSLLRTEHCPSAKTPASRSTGSPLQPQRMRTKPSRTAQSEKY